jgi:hypothetical protein
MTGVGRYADAFYCALGLVYVGDNNGFYYFYGVLSNWNYA